MSALPSNVPKGPSKDDVARRLAAAHRELDPSLLSIYRVEAPGREADPNEPVKLLEVNRHTTASGMMPVYFGAHPSSGVVFASIILEIHPTEWEALQKGSLKLPNGWRLGPAL